MLHTDPSPFSRTRLPEAKGPHVCAREESQRGFSHLEIDRLILRAWAEGCCPWHRAACSARASVRVITLLPPRVGHFELRLLASKGWWQLVTASRGIGSLGQMSAAGCWNAPAGRAMRPRKTHRLRRTHDGRTQPAVCVDGFWVNVSVFSTDHQNISGQCSVARCRLIANSEYETRCFPQSNALLIHRPAPGMKWRRKGGCGWWEEGCPRGVERKSQAKRWGAVWDSGRACQGPHEDAALQRY